MKREGPKILMENEGWRGLEEAMRRQHRTEQRKEEAWIPM